MSFGIFSGTASNGLGCCALAASARHANKQPVATRSCGFIVSSAWVELRVLRQRLDSCGRNLLVFSRLHARDPYPAQAHAFGHDRQPTLHRRDAGHAEHRVAAGLDALLPDRAGTARLGRCAPLLHRDARVGRAGAVHARQVQQVAAVVEDGDADVPVVALRLGFRGGGNPAAVLEGEHRSCFHACRAWLICSSALGSSMVVRSPGSRPSARAWIERRSVLPERVFGSSVTKCTAFGRAMAPRCLSTVAITSFSSLLLPSAELNLETSFATAKASGSCPLRASATPTTAHSAMFGCMLTASSISRVPRRWPATLITSSVPPRMKLS